jgi:phospholipid transport system substrate-binding protein
MSALRLLLPALCLLGGLVAAPAEAQDAQRYLKTKHDAALRILSRPANGEAAIARRNAQLDQMLAALLDYEELSRRALSDHWASRSEEERRVFVDLLKQLVERNYQGTLERTQSYEVRYVGENPIRDGVVVQTVARSRENRRAPELTIDYSMRRVGSAWKVFDVSTEGVSMVRNYRSQFNRIIARDGWDGLVNRMRDHLARGNDL